MNNQTKVLTRALFIVMVSLTTLWPAKAQSGLSYQVFYDDLSPYGFWVNDPQYGYVWVPDVQNDFAPYNTNGYWVLTDYGWTWVSNYSWGWAPFHYGRWNYDTHYGYMWIPGNEWGPGWVAWRRSGHHYGWAPMGPSVSMNVAYDNGYHPPHNHWNFVHQNHFGRSDINNYYVDNSTNITIINNATVINNKRVGSGSNVEYSAGPSQDEIEKNTGKKHEPLKLRENSDPREYVSTSEVRIYRPKIETPATKGGGARPAKITDMKDLKQRSHSPAPKKNGKQNDGQMAPKKEDKSAPNRVEKQPMDRPADHVSPERKNALPDEPKQATDKHAVQPQPADPRGSNPAKQRGPKMAPVRKKPAKHSPKKSE